MNRHQFRTICQRTLVVSAIVGCAAISAAKNWEPNIQKFEKKDKVTSPTQNGILFVGSSSIVKWDVDKYFPDMPVTNRGFGGSQVSDVIQYFDRVVVPYHPKVIVFYSGDNDISGGKTTSTVVADVKKFVDMVHEAFPTARLFIIPPKPSVARWKIWPAMQEVGNAEKQMAEKDPLVTFVDIAPVTLTKDGKADPDIFIKDGLHMNDKGYVIWSDLIRPQLKAALETTSPPVAKD